LDKRVAEQFRLSRSAAQEAVLTGRVDVEGVRCDEPGRMVPPDILVTFDPNRPKARRVIGVPLTVMHEDAHILIVNKPFGILTLPTASHEPDTLATRVERYLRIRHKGAPGGGGTSFIPVFNWVDEQRLTPDALVYLTDMKGSFPQHAPSYPVIWGSILKDKKAPFGEIVDIPKQAA
jgi:ribosomal 50S subunit-recycling heat shock protein